MSVIITKIKNKNLKKKYSIKGIINNMEYKLFGKTKDEVNLRNHEFLMIESEKYRNYISEEKRKELLISIGVCPKEKFKIGLSSLIGVGGKPPYKHGNYWSCYIDGESYPVINIWKENFEYLLNIGFFDNGIHYILYNDLLYIIPPSDEHKHIIPSKIKKECIPFFMKEPFLKYNLHRSVSKIESERIKNTTHRYQKMWGFYNESNQT